MTKIIAFLIALLLLGFATAALADSTISGLTSGGTVQTQDLIPVARPSSPGTNFHVSVGSAATVNIGTSGATVPLLNGTNTYSGLQTFLSGDLTAADPVFTGGSLLLPVGTTGARPGSPINGMIRYNSTTPGVEAYVNGAWGPLAGSGGSAWSSITGTPTTRAGYGITDALSNASVIAAGGPTGSASVVPVITYNAQGQLTAVSSATITPPAIGAPTTSGTGASGTWGISISGNAATVTTNANLTGPVTSAGNATSITAASVTNTMLANPAFTIAGHSVALGGSQALGFADLTGSATAAQLPNPSATTIGGIESYASVSHQWLNAISTSGVPSSTQPAFTDISGTASNSQIPAPTTGALGGLLALASSTAHQVVQYIDTSGVQHLVQFAFSDISGSLNLATQVTSTLPVANGGTNATSASTAISSLLSNPASGIYALNCTGSTCTPTTYADSFAESLGMMNARNTLGGL